ncbi:ERMP1-like protein [Mya arenaria]|uniref:ERMP1-like protein n=1 Tax=Mya arenaria TaxID=6604 RepID=A0ABY7FPT5_MYAAR|nr:ERMP1-like protein [Mya arenaria]
MAAPMDENYLRNRLGKSAAFDANGTDIEHDNKKSAKRKVNGAYLFTCVFVFYLAIFIFVRFRSFSFPLPKSQDKHSPKDVFYETNARIHLKEFSLHGPRVVGSDANEVYAYQYILKQLRTIQTEKNPLKDILIDEQNATGSFDIEFLSDFVSVYRNIKNVAAMVKSETGSKHSLLMSCHFDSSIDSPGAGDNAISCAVMIEVLRVFSQMKEKIDHNIIFLFNGAEENLLQASHGFITKHPWAKSIRAFVNIDSAGAGGWEVVFQTGPSHPWLVRAYAESAPYPSGSIMGQEMFQSGIIPSDTDFRIYRDFGEIPGLDIAYITNGYVYHTQNDKTRYIQPGCVQRGGETLLALLKKLSSSSHLIDPGEDKHGTMIFFDFVGYVMIFYPQSVAVMINSALVATIVFRILRKTLNMVPSDQQDPKYLKNLLTAVVCLVLTWVAMVMTCVAMALGITLLGGNMSWFTHNYNLVPLYVLPSIIVIILLQDTFHNTIFKGIGSAFMPMLYVLGPLVVRDRTMWASKAWNWRDQPWSFVALHLLSLLVPVLMTIYAGHAVFVLFIPIFGRTGTSVNADVAIGALCAILLVPLTGYLVSLCYLCHGLRRVCAVLGGVSLVWLAVILLTPLGFPYSADLEQPSPMRLLALHSVRRSRDSSGTVVHEDSGILLLPFDYSNNTHLVKAIPRLSEAKDIDCELGPYCGVPYLIPIISMIHPKHSLYLPVKSHTRPPVQCVLTKKQYEQSSGYTRLDFDISGPDHFTVQVRPHAGVSLERWSVSEYVPEPAAMPHDVNETTYFVYYSHGQKPDGPWQFSIYLKTAPGHDESKGLVDMGLSGHYLHSAEKHTKEMDAFLAEAPNWTTSVSWAATWDGYVF